jgi:hypothetical protein
VQGKALAGLLVLALVLLGGCGGGGSSGEAPVNGGFSSESKVAVSPAPASKADAAAQLQRAPRRVKREGEDAQRSPSSSPRAKPTPEPPTEPKSTHHDSGGGAAQFATKSGDNSIQESGEEASASEREAAAAVLHAYLDARVVHHWDEACFYMAASLVATVEQFAARYGKHKGVKNCPEVLAVLGPGSGQRVLEETAQADVGALRTERDHGFLLYSGVGGVAYAMPVVSEGEGWKVSSLDGTPLP